MRCLKLLDLDREGRLTDVKNARGSGEATMLGDRVESPKLAEYYSHNQ
jgi:hypothetical protein